MPRLLTTFLWIKYGHGSDMAWPNFLTWKKGKGNERTNPLIHVFFFGTLIFLLCYLIFYFYLFYFIIHLIYFNWFLWFFFIKLLRSQINIWHFISAWFYKYLFLLLFSLQFKLLLDLSCQLNYIKLILTQFNFILYWKAY